MCKTINSIMVKIWGRIILKRGEIMRSDKHHQGNRFMFRLRHMQAKTWLIYNTLFTSNTPKIGPKPAKQVQQQFWVDSKVVQSCESPFGSPRISPRRHEWSIICVNDLLQCSLNMEQWADWRFIEYGIWADFNVLWIWFLSFTRLN